MGFPSLLPFEEWGGRSMRQTGFDHADGSGGFVRSFVGPLVPDREGVRQVTFGFAGGAAGDAFPNWQVRAFRSIPPADQTAFEAAGELLAEFTNAQLDSMSGFGPVQVAWLDRADPSLRYISAGTDEVTGAAYMCFVSYEIVRYDGS